MLRRSPAQSRASPKWRGRGWGAGSRAAALTRARSQGSAPEHRDDDGIVVVQQKTGKELWVPLHANLRAELETWEGSPYVLTPKGTPYGSGAFRAAWTRLMNDTPAGKIRQEGFTFHGLRASSCEKLWEAGCSVEEISSFTGMSPSMIRRYLRFANQKRLAKAAMRRLEGRTARELPE